MQDPDVLEDLWDSSLGDVEACINAALLVSGGKDHKSSRGGQQAAATLTVSVAHKA